MLAQSDLRLDPTVDVLMTRRPIVVASTQRLAVAAELMRSCRVRHLPVLEAGRLVGVLSLGDVLAGEESDAIADVMTTAVRTATPATTLSAACSQMLGQRVSCLPVVDHGALVGIFTATDALTVAVSLLKTDEQAVRGGPTVAQLMTARPVATSEVTATLADAWERMQEAHVRHLPILSDGAVIGMLSDRDVLAAGRGRLEDAAARLLLVADAMNPRLWIVRDDRPALEAAATLLRRRAGALAVLRGNQLRGILTVSDFLYWLLSRI